VVNPWANNSSGLVNEKASLDEPFRGEPEEQGEEKGSLNLPILFCRKCGNKLPENSKFCNVCGERIIMHEVKED
jgi:hypothetical protein